VTLARLHVLADLQLDVGAIDAAERTLASLERGYAGVTDAAGTQRRARMRGEIAARLHLFRGSAARAEQLAREAIELQGAGAGVPTRVVLARALIARGAHREAIAVLEAARSLAVAAGDQAQTALVEVSLARAEHALGKRAEAIDRARRARDVLARFPGQPEGRRDVAAFLAAARR
jgi:tetratricopeptide (TPR) repeat protein